MNIHEHGIEIKRKVISSSIINSILEEISSWPENLPRHGIRNAEKKFSTVHSLAHSAEFTSLATHILGSIPSIVRTIFFDKTFDKNWLVSWHQDKTIALNRKTEINGWGPWTLKDGTYHVQPPVNILEQMLTFRLHLDDADEFNGCLKVIPQSHKLGILSQPEVTKTVNSQEPYLCEVEHGDLVLMKPHILHASTKSTKPSHRRVVHIEYSNFILPKGLVWA